MEATLQFWQRLRVYYDIYVIISQLRSNNSSKWLKQESACCDDDLQSTKRGLIQFSNLPKILTREPSIYSQCPIHWSKKQREWPDKNCSQNKAIPSSQAQENYEE